LFEFFRPGTHEDDPVRAVHAALQIHEAVNRMNAWISQKTGCTICMHTGINTDLVLTGNVNREDGSHGLTGLDLNIAARLEGIAGYRQIQDGAMIVY
jgi:class 3 adenylate cyclase